ncbi:MAG TPA: hypothetical protein VMT85_01455 [Thermoanaerobaculia bacterium]|nr:hypothetical protein [Thermoanaerobaculia bacterium]
MSPEERRAVAVLARLREEIANERSVQARCHTEALGFLGSAPEPLGRSELVHLAALIHAYYTAFEALVERVVRQLDLEVDPDRVHEEGERLIQIEQRLTVALDRFVAFLSGAIDELAADG